LLKQPAGLDVEPTDYFMYNNDFESTDSHISLNTEKLNEAIENNASIDATVLIPREQQVTGSLQDISRLLSLLRHLGGCCYCPYLEGQTIHKSWCSFG
jgi:hypothetical protein